MVFIGAGALLTQAVGFAHRNGHVIDGIFCQPGDPSAARLAREGFTVQTSDDLGDLTMLVDACSDNLVFSINNKFLLPDALLARGPRFFNIHNGLVQQYRGIAEVCLFAAICRGESEYGATLHELLPAQQVDSGPVLAQSSFVLATTDTFSIALKKSLHNCQHLFERSLQGICDATLQPVPAPTGAYAYSYKDVGMIFASAMPQQLALASALGVYAGFFPKLRHALSALE